jgi:hypothetical protein
MSNEAVIAVIVAVVLALVIVGIVLFVLQQRRHRHLRETFGPEYNRAVEDAGSRRRAEQELAERERRHDELELTELAPEVRARYAQEWSVVQEQFVDSPEEAVGEADRLVTIVMAERGYPTDDYRQRLDDLSVEHARTLDHYRSAHTVNERRRSHEATTEDLRQAMVHYRALFDDLLGTAQTTDGTTRTTDGTARTTDATARTTDGTARDGSRANNQHGR